MTKETAKAEFKYGLEDVQKSTGLKPASIRAGLRGSHFKRSGTAWGWNTKAELDEVLKYFADRGTRRPDMTKGKSKKEAKAPKAKKEAKAKKGKAKKETADA